MATLIQNWEAPPAQAIAGLAESWYAVQTYARHEKAVAQRLEQRGIPTFLPLITEVHRWSDRKRTVQLPLFSCYVFAKILPTNEDRLRILRADGVLNLVGKRGEGTPIPDEQIDSVRILLQEQLPWTSHSFLQIGQRVRVCSGALTGMEGVLLSRAGDRMLVISVDAIQRSLAVKIEGYQVEAA
jgi:transcription antitermination factor NusG